MNVSTKSGRTYPLDAINALIEAATGRVIVLEADTDNGALTGAYLGGRDGSRATPAQLTFTVRDHTPVHFPGKEGPPQIELDLDADDATSPATLLVRVPADEAERWPIGGLAVFTSDGARVGDAGAEAPAHEQP